MMQVALSPRAVSIHDTFLSLMPSKLPFINMSSQLYSESAEVFGELHLISLCGLSACCPSTQEAHMQP